MPTITLYIAQSLDGYIASKDGSVAWLDAFQSSDYSYDTFYASVDIVVMGSNTYEQVLTFGDYPYKDKLTHVYTKKTLPKPPHCDITFFSHLETKIYTQLPSTKHVWLVGGSQLIQSFFEHNLITHITLFTMPILLGSGISLFRSTNATKLTGISIEKYPNGVFSSSYVINNSQ